MWGISVSAVVNVFMARTGNKIVKIERFYLDKQGKATTFPFEDEKAVAAKGAPIVGVTIEFINEKRSKPQRIYYVGTNVIDKELKNKMELITFIKSFPNKVGFMKSASYIPHNPEFEIVRKTIREETKAILQDDTGLPYREYMADGWDVKLFGKYAPPIADFRGFGFQPDLNQVFKKDSTIEKIDFTFGYHYVGSKETDKGRDSNTSILLCKKK